MCNGFGGFYSRDGRVYFSEPDITLNCSHSKTAERLPLGVRESNLVPFECSDWSVRSFEWHTNAVPEWVSDGAKKRVMVVLKNVKPHIEEYRKVRGTALEKHANAIEAATVKYRKVINAAWTEYERVRDASWKEYEKIRDAALAYNRVFDAALVYNRVFNAAEAKYEKTIDEAGVEYRKVRDTAREELTEKLKQIDGYLEEAR